MAVNFPTMQQININMCFYKEESKGCPAQVPREFSRSERRGSELWEAPTPWSSGTGHGDAGVGNVPTVSFIRTYFSEAVLPWAPNQEENDYGFVP